MGLLFLFFPKHVEAAEESTAPANSSEAVFVSWNLRNYAIHPPAAGRGSAKPEAAREAVAGILADLNPSIIGLAEVGCEESLNDLQKRLEERGIRLPHKFLLAGPDEERRLALLSKFPFVANHSRPHVPFELAGAAQVMQRGVLDLVVELPGGMPLRLIGVHLKSPREVPEFDQQALRAREARELRRHIDAIFEQNTGVSLLVWGDFNMLKNDPAWRVIAGSPGVPQSLQVMNAVDEHGLGWTHHWEAADLFSRIDFIFVSQTSAALVGDKRARVVDHSLRQLASDHRPLALTLTWK